jgi:hypothetical protein
MWKKIKNEVSVFSIHYLYIKVCTNLPPSVPCWDTALYTLLNVEARTNKFINGAEGHKALPVYGLEEEEEYSDQISQ